jgi:hypothetical protein
LEAKGKSNGNPSFLVIPTAVADGPVCLQKAKETGPHTPILLLPIENGNRDPFQHRQALGEF